MKNDPHWTAKPENFKPLTPLDFLDRALRNQPDSLAVIWREHSWNYSQFASIVGRLRNYISELNMETEDVVSVMAGNRPEMLAAHYAIPAEGAVLNSINTRLDSETEGWILQHSESKLLLCVEHSAETAKKLLKMLEFRFKFF